MTTLTDLSRKPAYIGLRPQSIFLTQSMYVDTVFRRPTATDSDLLADLVTGDPEQETTKVTMRLYGISDFERARELFRLLWRAGENWKLSEIALIDDTPDGVLQTGRSSVRVTPRIVFAVLQKLGLRELLRMPSRLRLQRHVVPDKPAGAYVISEIHVAPSFRGRGLGEVILAHAEDAARARGFEMMALHTLTTNPARRFYERCGFEAVAERHDDEFRRITGASGNILFVKRIQA